jgi:hypothetical protein
MGARGPGSLWPAEAIVVIIWLIGLAAVVLFWQKVLKGILQCPALAMTRPAP